jgi:glutaredoxin
VRIDLYTSAFCDPCARTRAVLAEAARLVPAATVVERDVAFEADAAEADGIRSTPTVIVRDGAGAEVVRAEGVPTLDQVLVALAKAV